LVKLMPRFRESGSPAAVWFGGHRRPILDAHAAAVCSIPKLSAQCDI